jgi:hypothetical protein
MEISTGAHWAFELKPVMRADTGILFWIAETKGSVRASAHIHFDRLEFQARSAGQVDLGIPRAGQVVIVRRSLLKRRGYS